MSAVRRLGNLGILWVTAFVLVCFGNAFAQGSYQVTDLGTVGTDNESMVMSLNTEGWSFIMAGNVGGLGPNNLLGQLENGHGYLGIYGLPLYDLGTLGGQNTWMNWGEINDFAQIVGYSETKVPDPNGEDICGFGTHLTCRPFIWQLFQGMRALPTLGGNNGEASAINDAGQIVGMTENGTVDSTCAPGTTNNHVQVPTVWEHGKAKPLSTGSNPDGFAFWNNDRGQIVGDTATCGNATVFAASWQNGTLTTLPDYGTGSLAFSVNHEGVAAGTVGSADGTTQAGAIWTNGVLTYFGLLPGDFGGLADSINSQGQVVGGEWDSGFYWNHGFIWQNGVLTDLNTLIPANSNLYIVFPGAINERGQIGGQAVVVSGPEKGAVHSFLLTPVYGPLNGPSVADVVHTRPGSDSPATGSQQAVVGRPGFIHHSH